MPVICGRVWKFGDAIDTDVIPPGLDEGVIRQISARKREPEWVLDYRLKARKVRIDLETDMDHQSQPIEIEDKSQSPARRLIGKELDRLIQKAINALPARQRLVVVLRDIEGVLLVGTGFPVINTYETGGPVYREVVGGCR